MEDLLDVESLNMLTGLVRALSSEDTLGAVVRVHLYIENELEQFIRLRLPEGAYNALKLTYSAKIRLAGGLGYPKSGVATLEQVGKIRNDFAHKLDTELTDEAMAKLWEAFGPEGQDIMIREFTRVQEPSELFEPPPSPKKKFEFFAVGIWALLRVENNRWRRDNLTPRAG